MDCLGDCWCYFMCKRKCHDWGFRPLQDFLVAPNLFGHLHTYILGLLCGNSHTLLSMTETLCILTERKWLYFTTAVESVCVFVCVCVVCVCAWHTCGQIMRTHVS